jgi:hypothetical protein
MMKRVFLKSTFKCLNFKNSDTPGEIGQGRRGGSSDEDDGHDGLLGVDGDDDVLLDRKTPDDEKKEGKK